MAEGEGERATKQSWQTKPMPELSTTIELNEEFSADDMKNISKGYIPQEMEEKWFLYYEDSENALYMHRSWTGMCIYIVKFEDRGDGKFAAIKAEVNRDTSQYTCTDDEQDKELLFAVLKGHLLGRFDW